MCQRAITILQMRLACALNRFDFRSRDSLTPMHKAAIIGNDKALKTLLELGAFAEVVDARTLTPLYLAILHAASVQCIEHLLFNGSPVGLQDANN